MLRIIREGRENPIIRIGFDMVVRRRTPPLRKMGRILDVGCSNGAYLAALRSQGWEVEGIEMDGVAADYAINERRLKVTTGDAESVLARLPDQSYDVVTMWHLLEHLFDPAAALANARRILRPGGMLMLEVPNFAATLAGIFRKNWFALDVPRHLYHFTPDTLRALLMHAGMQPRRVRGVPAPEVLVWSMTAARQGQPIDWARGQRLNVNPVWMGLAFPVSWTLAQLGKGDHMAAVAVRT
jgi:2-polyprenyl-3-methyl-5-hydroxy-6-metoxy-1,4-benzoquinol methylase